jgi:putative sterol carrier protein
MSTPKIVFEQEIPAQMKENPSRAKEVNSVYQFNISGDEGGEWFVDLTKEGGETGAGQHPAAKCTINTDVATFMGIVNGTVKGPAAFMSGKLKIKGDMSLAMKLGKVLGK